MKLVTIIGARPQFIKAATVSRAIADIPDVVEVLVHTGQHYDANMSDVFFEQMDIPRPNYHLGIGGGSHGAMTGRQLERIEEVLVAEKPDWVLVYGDTNSTLAGALASAKLHIPVAHVEAGLRSFNRRMPEEINRVLADHVATLLFAPTDTARTNLLAEGVNESGIRVVGDVMYDATLFHANHAAKPDWFDGLGVDPETYVLCTIHRAENTDDLSRLRQILQGVAEAGAPVILPLHPRTSRVIEEAGIALPANIHRVAPVGFLEMVWLESNCLAIATDSGGIQKEAYFHKKPCVTFRDETEWVELVEAGVNVVVGANANAISAAICSKVDSGGFGQLLYGDGNAASRIVTEILRWRQ